MLFYFPKGLMHPGAESTQDTLQEIRDTKIFVEN